MKLKILFILVSLFASTFANAKTLVGYVIGVADGDTITVIDATNKQFKVRLAGIDAPEKKQSFGKISKKALSDLVFNKDVSVEWSKKDHYKRVIGKVMINGIDVNLLQIKNGYAWFYHKYKSELVFEDQQAYLNADAYAHESHSGLWKENNPIAPWDFRRAIKLKRKESLNKK